ncbi:hypothetical protein HK104_007779 [Borealophlyctis nickersoniae]|nr:hypothetical protein HK104_007779 [Borealophlyctis nickersoniae]
MSHATTTHLSNTTQPSNPVDVLSPHRANARSNGNEGVGGDLFEGTEDPRVDEESAKKEDGHNWTWSSPQHEVFRIPEPKPEQLPTLKPEDTTPASDPDNVVARRVLAEHGGQSEENNTQTDDVVYVEHEDGSADLVG